MKTICKEDCGNAPLKRKILEFSMAFGNGQVENIIKEVSPDIVWELVGEKMIAGLDAFRQELEEMKEHAAKELHIEHIITHGRTVACNGTIEMEGGERFAFCDIYNLNRSGAKAQIRKMISFVVKT
jgi:predicted ester cyclase